MALTAPIVVTGAAGFIGVNLCLSLRHDSTQRVVGLVRNKQPDAAQTALQQAGIDLHEVNLHDPAQLKNLLEHIQPRAVVHLAAQANVQQRNFAALMAANVQGQANLLQAIAEVGGVQQVVYASSYAVYGQADNQTGSTALREDTPFPPPATPYAASKQMAEILAHAWSESSGIPTTGLRLFNVIGPWARAGTMAPFFAQKLMAGQPVPLFNQGTLIRDFIAVSDVAAAIGALLQHPGTGPRVFNIGSGTGHTTQGLVEALANHFGVNATLEMLPPQPHEPLTAVADITHIKQLTGWQPRFDFLQTVQTFATWWQAQYGNC